MGAERVGDELRREAAPRERRAGRQCGGDAANPAAAAQRVGRKGHGAQRRQGGGQRPAADVVRGRRRGDRGEEGDTADDRRDGEYVAGADALVQRPRPEDEQEHQAEGQRRLHDSERREQQRDRLQGPAEEPEGRARQPARAAQQAPHERRAQAVRGRHHARLDRLQRDAEVVHRGCRARGQRAEDDGGHDATPR
jgi:hypothetical protein